MRTMEKLLQSAITTPLGKMLIIASDQHLYLLTFLRDRKLTQHLARLKKIKKLSMRAGKSTISKQVKKAVSNYFLHQKDFPNLPLQFIGSAFQKKVWRALQTIPSGKTVSYTTISKKIKKPTANRAVANAIGSNPFALIIPCHRVIRNDGQLGGYAGGVKCKVALLQHEGFFKSHNTSQ